MSAALQVVESAWAEGYARERRLTVSEWADAHRELTQTSSREPGRWRTSRTPYLREIMDELSPQSRAERVVFMKGAQIGGTEAGNNWIGFTIHHNPGPMLMVLPTIDVARRVSKQRIAPMIRASRVLRERVRESRARDSGNTLLTKEYDGGVLLMAGANSSAGLRSMPVRDLFPDELDDYPPDVDGQGDPLDLAEERTNTYEGVRKIYCVSTPTIRNLSRIEALYRQSDRRRYFLQCPECGHWDFLTWRGRDWVTEVEGTHHNIRIDNNRPDTAHMRCGLHGCRVDERHKTAMLRGGEWRPTRKDHDGRIVGFHLSALYSPSGWRTWSECAAKFLKAKNDPPALKTWINTTLGETYEERGDSVESHALRRRCAKILPGSTGWPRKRVVPDGVGALIAAVDTQADRLEVVVKGYGAGEESWLVDYERLPGDPSASGVWADLDRYHAQTFVHETSGRELRIDRMVVDTGGLHTEEVYRYVKPRLARGVFGVKGGNMSGRPLVDRPSYNNRYRLPLFVLCVDTGKEVVLSRLLVDSPGPGYVHIPDWVDDEYLDQLTSEKGIRKYVKGRGLSRVWLEVHNRHEALDLEVYALAGLYIMGTAFIREIATRAAAFATTTAGTVPEAPPAVPTLRNPGKAFPARPRRGWVDKWRE